MQPQSGCGGGLGISDGLAQRRGHAVAAAAGAGGREAGMGTTTCEVPSAGPAALAGDGICCSAGVADSIGYPISAANQRFCELSCKLLCTAKCLGKKILPVATPRAWRGSALPCD